MQRTRLLPDFPTTDEEIYEMLARFEPVPRVDPDVEEFEMETGFEIYQEAMSGSGHMLKQETINVNNETEADYYESGLA
jgi:hypothetical protein